MKKTFLVSMIAAVCAVMSVVSAQAPATPAPAAVTPAPAIPSNAPVLLKLIPEKADLAGFINGQAFLESPVMNLLFMQFMGKDIKTWFKENDFEQKNQQGIAVFYINYKDVAAQQFEVGGVFQTMKNNAKDSYAQIANSAMKEFKEKGKELETLSLDAIKVDGKDALRIREKSQKLDILVIQASEDTVQFRMQSGMDTPIQESLIPFRGEPTKLASALDLTAMFSVALNAAKIREMAPGEDPLMAKLSSATLSLFEKQNTLSILCIVDSDPESALLLKAQLDASLDPLKEDEQMKDILSLIKSSVDGSKLVVRADFTAEKIVELIGNAMMGFAGMGLNAEDVPAAEPAKKAPAAK